MIHPSQDHLQLTSQPALPILCTARLEQGCEVERNAYAKF